MRKTAIGCSINARLVLVWAKVRFARTLGAGAVPVRLLTRRSLPERSCRQVRRQGATSVPLRGNLCKLELCRVRIEGGLLVWSADGEPVTLPAPGASDEGEGEGVSETARSRALSALVEERLAASRRREELLYDARLAVEAAIRGHDEPVILDTMELIDRKSWKITKQIMENHENTR